MSNPEDDGIDVTIHLPVEVGTAYNAIVQLTDAQVRTLEAELIAVAVGRVVHKRRVAAGVDLSEFARRAGIGIGRVRQFERAKGHKGMTLATLAMLARALGMPASRLLAMAEKHVHGSVSR